MHILLEKLLREEIINMERTHSSYIEVKDQSPYNCVCRNKNFYELVFFLSRITCILSLTLYMLEAIIRQFKYVSTNTFESRILNDQSQFHAKSKPYMSMSFFF